MSKIKTAFVLGVTADIGLGLADRLLRDGWRVVGVGRDRSRVEHIVDHDDFVFLPCDLASKDSIAACVSALEKLNLRWSLFVSAAGTMEPIGSFFDQSFDAWADSIDVNMIGQLRVLHGIWRFRTPQPHIMFLAGGGTNNPMRHYSAYCISKIALIKMCELIDDEESDANVFIIGPGYVRTRIHIETLRAGDAAGGALEKTRAFLDGDNPGTSMDDIYGGLVWCINEGRQVVGGRNISIVHDPWRDDRNALADELRGSADAFRLRRHPAERKAPK
jgi:NAD(P)-dependent dehydrogenase (short-subunit alcohol dehydrogenase family)